MITHTKTRTSKEINEEAANRELLQDAVRRFQLAYLLSLEQSHRLEIYGWDWQNPDWRSLKVRHLTNGRTRLYFRCAGMCEFLDTDLKQVPFTHTSDWLRGAISLGKNYQKRLENRQSK